MSPATAREFSQQQPTSVSGPFTAEQARYLEGFFTGLGQRAPFAAHTASGQITCDSGSGLPNAAAPETLHRTAVEDLCREERWKYDENPLDIWEKLLAHAGETEHR